jgi:hypothetical protein
MAAPSWSDVEKLSIWMMLKHMIKTDPTILQVIKDLANGTSISQ